MTRTFLCILLLLVVLVLLLVVWYLAVRKHAQRLEGLRLIVHVNGIRGKSSVTRLVAGVLRAGGITTVAKTTGSAAMSIYRDGSQTPIHRYGAATINEQIEYVKQMVDEDVDAMVIECMAVRPLYQQYSQDKIVRSNVTIITNVRLDHQEEMGETLEEIAISLCNTVPYNGYLITSEDRPHLRAILEEKAAERGSEFIFADPSVVTPEDMRGFDYIQHRENVAIGLVIADLAGVPRETAIRGMWESTPDVGMIWLKEYPIRDKTVLWVPMFAANDKESVVGLFELLKDKIPEDSTVIGLLNNRTDRGRRAELFANLAATELADDLDHVITTGEYEKPVTKAMLDLGFPESRLHNRGETSGASLDELLDTIAGLVEGDHGALLGMVNIHTHQAEELLEYFAELDGAEK